MCTHIHTVIYFSQTLLYCIELKKYAADSFIHINFCLVFILILVVVFYSSLFVVLLNASSKWTQKKSRISFASWWIHWKSEQKTRCINKQTTWKKFLPNPKYITKKKLRKERNPSEPITFASYQFFFQVCAIKFANAADVVVDVPPLPMNHFYCSDIIHCLHFRFEMRL